MNRCERGGVHRGPRRIALVATPCGARAQNIVFPVFHNPAVVIEPEDVECPPSRGLLANAGSSAGRHTGLSAIKRRNATRLPGYSRAIPREVVDERILPIRDHRIVLG